MRGAAKFNVIKPIGTIKLFSLPPDDVRGKFTLRMLPAVLSGTVLLISYTEPPAGPTHCMDDEMQPKVAKKGSTLLNQHRLHAEKQWLSLDQICQDPSNRDEEGTKVDECLSKAELIEHQGFDFEKVRCVVVQMPLSEEKRKLILSKQHDWHSEDSRYPLSDEKLLEFTCVGGNHLLTFLKMVKASVSCASFVSVQAGMQEQMSVALLSKMDSDFGKAVTNGIPCVVLSRDVRDIDGALTDIQASENQGHSINTLESDKQCILRCASRLASPSVDLDALKTSLQNQFPHLKDHVPGYIKFTQEIGGVDSVHFRYWKICDARFGSNTAGLRGKFLEEISNVSPTYPFLKRSLVLAARFVPRNKLPMRLTIVDWFSISDVKKIMGSSEEELQHIEDTLKSFEAIVAAIPAQKDRYVFQARSDCRLMRLVCDKKDKGFPIFESFEAIVTELKVEVSEFISTKRVTPRSDSERSSAQDMPSDMVFFDGYQHQTYFALHIQFGLQ